ncbi:hypothetical protein JCM19000A_27530 [Silvimonas sp. JCM 19000]
MKLGFGNDWVKYKEELLKFVFPVSDAREIEGLIIVLHDYMSFLSDVPSRNLFAYGDDGALV